METALEDSGHIAHKPDKKSFVTYGVVKSVLGAIALLLMVYLGLRCFPSAPTTTIMAVLFGLMLLQTLSTFIILPIRYKKESYSIRSNRLIAKGGSILSSYEQELLIKNITHVALELPYLEHKFFQTGSIHIQAAGGDEVEIHMRSIGRPKAMYKEIMKLLEKNGFSVSCDMLVEADKPDARGVWLTTIGAGIISSGVLVWIAAAVGGASQDPSLAGKFIMGWEFVLLIALIVISGLGGLVLLHGRGMRREYRMYEDAITSKTDYFGVDETIIPMKNLSDSALNQGLIGRVLGIHHVSMSCQGSGHEIVFQHVARGEQWKKSLNGLLKSLSEKRAADKAATKELTQQTPGAAPKPTWEGKAERDESFTASFKMDKRYLFIPVLVMFGVAVVLIVGGGFLGAPAFERLGRKIPPSPATAAGLVMLAVGGIALLLTFLRALGSFITYQANTFKIMPTGFEQDFQFIFKRKIVFNADKVTGLILKRGIFDRMLGTGSVEFWSIGASDHLRFRHIRLDDELLSKIKAKVALYPKEEAHSVLTEASMMDTWKANLFFYAFLLLLAPMLASFSKFALVGLGVLFLLPFVFTNIYYKYHHLELYDDSLWFRKGIFWHANYYIRYEDIKYISSTRYPMTDTGTITFDVSGERVIKSDNGEHKVSNQFHVRYVPELPYRHQGLDMLLSQEIELEKLDVIKGSLDNYKPEVLQEAKPHMMQMLLFRGLALVILDAFFLGGAAFLLFGGGLNPAELAQLQQQPGVAFGLAWGLPILIAVNLVALTLVTMHVRSIHYVLDGQKVIKKWGVFFKKNLGIHYTDIDYIGKHQGAANKLFSTTNITVNTVGSSATDLSLDAMTDANRFYKALKQNYRPEEAV